MPASIAAPGQRLVDASEVVLLEVQRHRACAMRVARESGMTTEALRLAYPRAAIQIYLQF
jgi:hypothetical protein